MKKELSRLCYAELTERRERLEAIGKLIERAEGYQSGLGEFFLTHDDARELYRLATKGKRRVKKARRA